MANSDQLAELMDKSERLAVIKERTRILEELEKLGPTGDFFEMPWQELIDLIAPPASVLTDRTSTNK